MSGYLIGEEGPLSGEIFSFEEGEEWVLGRDPDEATVILEDPMVSRKHAICRKSPEGFVLENLSSVNPITQNGKVVEESVLLREGDIIQIGSTFFRFTEESPVKEVKEAPSEGGYGMEETPDLSTFRLEIQDEMRWLIKVISGPNSGAEFGMQKSSTYILGKDAAICDIILTDLSVSRQHARIIIDDEDRVFIEDLGSKNGVLVNGEPIKERRELRSQDVVALGTTSFLVLDRQEVHETLISPAYTPMAAEKPSPETEAAIAAAATLAPPKDWREMVILKKHLIIAGACGIFLILILTMLFGLFTATPVVVHEKNESEMIKQVIQGYEGIQFSFNPGSGKLFVVGHVITQVEKHELMYMLNNLPFVRDIDDNVVVDELVWENMNALLMTNPSWVGVSVYSPEPGRFILRGYLQTQEQASALTDYVNLNFSYLDKLENHVVVENNLATQIQSMLIEKGFGGVTFQLNNGDVIFMGAVDSSKSAPFTQFLGTIKTLMGVRSIKNYVVMTTQESARIDLTSQYQITGNSKKGGNENSVVINGKILSVGELLDGMNITSIQSNMVLLEKDGLKFKINYNLQ